MTTIHLRAALATVGGDLLAQPYVCDGLDAAVRLDADVYVGAAATRPRHREAWWRKMHEAGRTTYHRHDPHPVSTRLPVLRPWGPAVRLDVDLPTQVLGAGASGRHLERARTRGVTSIVAAELGGCSPAYHPDQVVAARHGSLWIVVVPAPGVDVTAVAVVHDGPVLAVDLVLRGERACGEARAAGRWPPRPVGLVARAAR